MKHKIIQFIYNHHYFGLLRKLLKKIRIRKKSISLYDIIKIFIDKLRQDEIIGKANGVAFNFTLAIFPAIIFIFTLIPYFDIPDLQIKIMAFLEQWMPVSMFNVVSSTIQDIISRPRGGLLSFGFVFAIYLATNGMISLMRAFNSCYKTVENRGFFKSHFIATALTAMLGFMFILAVLLLIIGEVALDWTLKMGLVTDDFLIYLLLITRLIVMFIIFQIGISAIYYFAPAVKYKWGFFSTGSIIATILSLAISYSFSYYISQFGTYNKFYGSIGALIALMIWFFFLSVIMLVGYEVNASIHKVQMEVKDLEDGKVAVV